MIELKLTGKRLWVPLIQMNSEDLLGCGGPKPQNSWTFLLFLMKKKLLLTVFLGGSCFFAEKKNKFRFCHCYTECVIWRITSCQKANTKLVNFILKKKCSLIGELFFLFHAAGERTVFICCVETQLKCVS